MIRKVRGGWAVVHCHGKKRKIIARHRTYTAALRQHRAIQVAKRLRKRKRR